MKNKIYMCGVWWNPASGSDGEDSVWIISSQSMSEAAYSAALEMAKDSRYRGQCINWVREIGQDDYANEKSIVILGPCYVSPDIPSCYKRLWTREYEEADWEDRAEDVIP